MLQLFIAEYQNVSENLLIRSKISRSADLSDNFSYTVDLLVTFWKLRYCTSTNLMVIYITVRFVKESSVFPPS